MELAWIIKLDFIVRGKIRGAIKNSSTCDDGILNGDEEEIDCGGSCKECIFEDNLTFYSCESNQLLGDVNGDGRILSHDAALALQISEGIATTNDLRCADVNCDGEVNLDDALLIQNYTIGLIEEFDCKTLEEISISIATVKDKYSIGEKIELTDSLEGPGPPVKKDLKGITANVIDLEEKEIFGDVKTNNIYSNKNLIKTSSQENIYENNNFFENEIYGENYFEEEFLEENSIERERIESSKFKGYLVEFEKEPVVSEYIRLEKNAEENEKSFWASVPIIKNFLTLPENVDEKVKSYSDELIQEHEIVKNRIVSGVKNQKGITGNAVSSPRELKVESEFTKVFNGISLEVNEEEAKEIEKISGVKRVYPNYEVKVTLMDSVAQIGADEVWKMDSNLNNCSESGEECLTGKGVTIGIIDTGIDYTHGDLGGCFGEGCKVVGGYDFVNNDDDPIDDHLHGTHVAAIAAGNGVLKGVAPEATMYGYKVLNSDGSGYGDWIIGGIERSIDPNQDGDFSDMLDIISLSLVGYGNPDDPMSQAIDRVVEAGVVAVIAAGNSGPGEQTIGSPGTARKAITVGAVDKQNQIAYFSSKGPVIWDDENGDEKVLIKPDVVAPGVDICAAQASNKPWDYRICLDDSHVAISGTSMATPHVAGSVALLKQKNPEWSPEEIKSSLKGTSIDLDEEAIVQGQGRVDVERVIKLGEPLEKPLDFYAYSEDKINNIYDKIEIKGIFPEDYDSLIVEYYDGVKWSGEGISIIGLGDLIAEFNPEGLLYKSGDYQFRVKIIKNEVEKEIILSVYFDKDLMGGWPIKLNFSYDSSLNLYSHPGYLDPLIYDLDNDGKKEIILYQGGDPSKIFVFDYKGNLIWEYPLLSGGGMEYLIITNLDDGDNFSEIVTSGWEWDGNDFSKINSYLFGINHDGSLYKKIALFPHFSGQIISADLNRDGDSEIIFRGETGSMEGEEIRLSIFDNKLNLITDKSLGMSPIDWGYGFRRSLPVVGNFDLDKDLEIASMDYFDTEFGENQPLTIFNEDGSIVEGWPKRLALDVFESPTSVDIDGDGSQELLVPGQHGEAGLYLFNGDGSIVEGWPVLKGLFSASSPILADLENNGEIEIVISGGSISNPKLFVLDKDGNNLPGWPIKTSWFANPIIADITGDGFKEIISIISGYSLGREYNFVYAWDFQGYVLKNFPKKIDYGGDNSPVAVDDLDGDGKLELVVSANSVPYETFSKVYVWDLDAPYNPETMDWPMFQHDPQHTGCYDCDSNFTLPPIPPTPIRPQSKLVNGGEEPLVGILSLILQENIDGNWIDSQIVSKIKVVIPANYFLGLDSIWNSKNVLPNETGNYRAYSKFETSEGFVEDSFDFEVVSFGN